MKKVIVSTLVIGLLLTSSMVTVNAISGDSVVEKQVSTDDETLGEVMPYMFSIEHEMELELEQLPMSVQGNDVELLWKNSDDVGLSRRSSIFSSNINDDDFPDVLVNRSALDGGTGELIWTTEAGKVCGVGDINNDGIDEIFASVEEIKDPDLHSMLYCLNGADGTIIWESYLESAWVFHISVGDLLGDELNEVIVGAGDWCYRNNHYVYCLNGISGDIIWMKHTGDHVRCTEIADVDADGKNEVIAGTSYHDPAVYCLDGENGNVIWDIVKQPYDADFRVLCIDDLNDDPYKEILVEMYWGGSAVFGICCLSGNNGSILWSWESGPSTGSFQSILTADLIDDYPGNEVIVGGVWGVYCLYGGNDPPSGGREIWHFVDYQGLTDIVMSAAIGDLDKDGLLDVAAITFQLSSTNNGYVFALNGQDGERMWKYEDCGTMNFYAIICCDLTGDGYPEVIAKDDSYVCALLSYSLQNLAPQTPVIDGPTTGNAGTPYDFSFNTTDPDGDNLYYYVDWGDNQRSWFGPYPSGEEATVSHTWSEQGTYHKS